MFRLLFGSWLMLGLWSYAYDYDDPYVTDLTSFLCFTFCFVFMLMLSGVNQAKDDVYSFSINFCLISSPLTHWLVWWLWRDIIWSTRFFISIRCSFLLTRRSFLSSTSLSFFMAPRRYFLVRPRRFFFCPTRRSFLCSAPVFLGLRHCLLFFLRAVFFFLFTSLTSRISSFLVYRFLLP